MRRILIAIVLFVTVMGARVLVQAEPPSAVMLPPAAPIALAQGPSSCDALITRAMDTAGSACGGLNRNQACYGNNLVHSEVRDGGLFATTGDITALDTLQKIITTPLDEGAQTWGIAVLKAQANIPGTLPGQNVTFVLFGDTMVDNPTPDMRAVTISTGLGRLSCADAPPSALLVQSPSGQNVTMNINGADVTLGSTVYMTATHNGVLTISTIEGHATLTAFGVSQTAFPGMQVSAQLGTNDELTVIDPPAPPAPFDTSNLGRLPLQLLPRIVSLPLDATVTPTLLACAARPDWTQTYTVQSGDSLSKIARLSGVSVGELQAGNCLLDPDVLRAGQTLRVPLLLPTVTPTVLPGTLTPIPSTPMVTATWPAPTGPDLRADNELIKYGKCTTIHWDADYIQAIYFEGEATTGHGSQRVCLKKSQTFTLKVVAPDGSSKNHTIRIRVGSKPTPTPPPGVCVVDGVCAIDESPSSCSADCVSTCGNLTCDFGPEDGFTCPKDCA